MPTIYRLGSEMLQPEVLEQIPSIQRKRQEAIFELIHTEKAYVHSLNLVKEVVYGLFYVLICGCGILGVFYSNGELICTDSK